MNTLSRILNILGRLWRTGNRITRRAIRWTLVITVVWIAMITISAMYNSKPAIFAASLLPIVILVIRIAWMNSPLILLALGLQDDVRTFYRWILTLIGAQLGIGLYLMLVNVSSDPRLVLYLILAVLCLVFLNTGETGKLVKTANLILTTIIIVITGIFILGGRGKIEKWWTDNKSTFTTAQAAPQPTIKRVVLKGNGQWSEPIDNSGVPSGWKRYAYAPKGTKIRFSDGTTGPADSSYAISGENLFFSGNADDTVKVLFLPRGINPPAEVQ